MNNSYRFRNILEIIFCFLLLFTGFCFSKECSGALNGHYDTESCAVGGCCIPSDGTGDTRCCIPTLTLILVSVFIGGTIVTIIVVILCCVICRYRKKRKLRQRLDERRRRQRERDQERQRRLMMDPFVNGDPFLATGQEVEGTSQPPHYHGQETDTNIPQQPPPSTQAPTHAPRQAPTQQNRYVPPPYPNSPPPAYYSRIGTRHENRHTSRTRNSTMESRSSFQTDEIQPEVTIVESPSTSIQPPATAPTIQQSNSRNSNSVSRINTDIPLGLVAINNSNNRNNSRIHNEQRVLTIQDLESDDKEDALGEISKPESRMSTKFSFYQNNVSRLSMHPEEKSPSMRNSRTSTKMNKESPTISDTRNVTNKNSRNSIKSETRNSVNNESRVSSHIMPSVSNNEQPRISNDNRGLFIKSRISVVPEDLGRDDIITRNSSHGRSYVRSVDPDERVVSNLDYV
ncbi:probable serine/threonine-protein kinase tsuA [Mytilus edulis]|uniref:probable serine/threonine-protein kinase tsuA n=1 Tax=Mytilus edulis TaxID=6550 RepID=UPI0039EF996B